MGHRRWRRRDGNGRWSCLRHGRRRRHVRHRHRDWGHLWNGRRWRIVRYRHWHRSHLGHRRGRRRNGHWRWSCLSHGRRRRYDWDRRWRWGLLWHWRWYRRFVICPGAAGARQVLGVPPSNTWLPRTSCLPRPFAGVNPEVVAIDRLTRVVAVMRYGGALKDGARNCIWTGRFHVAPGQLAPVVLLGARIVVARARGVPRCSWHLIPRLARSPINLDSGQVLVLSFVARGEIGVDIRLENLAVVFASAIAIFVVTVDASTVGATFVFQCLWEGRRRPLVGVAVGCSARLVAEMGGGRAFENVAGLSRATS